MPNCRLNKDCIQKATKWISFGCEALLILFVAILSPTIFFYMFEYAGVPGLNWHDKLFDSFSSKGYFTGMSGSVHGVQGKVYAEYITPMLIHTISGSFMLVLSTINVLRKRRDYIHRWIGRVFVFFHCFSLLGSFWFLAGTTGNSNVYTGDIFALVLWFYWLGGATFLGLGLYYIRKRQKGRHVQGMIYDYGIVVGAPLLRVTWAMFSWFYPIGSITMDSINLASLVIALQLCMIVPAIYIPFFIDPSNVLRNLSRSYTTNKTRIPSIASVICTFSAILLWTQYIPRSASEGFDFFGSTKSDLHSISEVYHSATVKHTFGGIFLLMGFIITSASAPFLFASRYFNTSALGALDKGQKLLYGYLSGIFFTILGVILSINVLEFAGGTSSSDNYYLRDYVSTYWTVQLIKWLIFTILYVGYDWYAAFQGEEIQHPAWEMLLHSIFIPLGKTILLFFWIILSNAGIHPQSAFAYASVIEIYVQVALPALFIIWKTKTYTHSSSGNYEIPLDSLSVRNTNLKFSSAEKEKKLVPQGEEKFIQPK